MKSRFDPWELTASGGRVRRTLSAVDLPRLDAEVGRLLAPVDVQLLGATDVAGNATLEGFVETRVEMTCQRCLEPMQLDIRSNVKLVVFASEKRLAELAAGFEPLFIGEGEELSLEDLVSDEVLLALPLAPCHDAAAGDGGGCVSVSDRQASFRAKPQVHRPFAELKQLLHSRQTQTKE